MKQVLTLDSMLGQGKRPVGHQSWRDLLFLHQPVALEVLRARVPRGLDVDTFDGIGWVTLIPFAIFASRPAGLPRLLSMKFLEVNLRTYVRGPDGEPGIYFFSLEASSRLAVLGARFGYGLPYFAARMATARERAPGGATIRYSSRRKGSAAALEVAWDVGPAVGTAAPGSLDHFLIERYVLFAQAAGRLYRARVRHRPYPLCGATVSRLSESLTAAAGLPPFPAAPPLAHHSPGVDVDLYWRRPVARAAGPAIVPAVRETREATRFARPQREA
jgi:hypothetical protein